MVRGIVLERLSSDAVIVEMIERFWRAEDPLLFQERFSVQAELRRQGYHKPITWDIPGEFRYVLTQSTFVKVVRKAR